MPTTRPSALRAVRDQPDRALALVRVSKERDGMISPELQTAAIDDYAARTRRNVVHRMEGLDESGSGARSKWWARLEEAVAMVEAGDIDVILVWKFSRTSRNRLRWAVALDRVEAAGGRLESATEQVDVTTSTGRFTRGMLAELAAFEAERIGEQWKETQARRRANGLPHSGRYRPGYIYADKHYTPDPTTAPAVVEAYRRYVGGEGFHRLAAWMTANEVPTPRGKPWDPRSVHRVLTVGFAAGLLQVHDPHCGCPNTSGHCKRMVFLPGAHEPLIDQKLWRRFLVELDRRSRTPPRLLSPSTPLSGLVRCSVCRYGMRVIGNGYRCDHVGCPQHVFIVRHRVETAALEWLAEYAADVEGRAVSTAVARSERTAARSTAARLLRSATALEQEMATLTREYARGVIPEGAYVLARDELAGELTAATAAAEEARQAADTVRPAPKVAAKLLGEWDTLSVADRNAILRSLLRVVVSRGEWRSTVAVTPAWEWRGPGDS